MNERTLLIDGDTLVFEAAAGSEYEAQWSWDLWTLHADLEQAVAKLRGSIEEIIEKLKATRTIIALSDGERWRTAVMPTYKNHRLKTRKPIVYRPLREYVHETYDCFQRPGLEGDDVLGILATHPKLVPGEKIVVSIDKDMQTIPGLHLNYAKSRGSENWESFIRAVSLAEADRYHLTQTLTGDSTDGYSGCPGIGPVTAAKVLDASCTWGAVVAAFAKKGLSEEVALQNARVARICRASDYDFQKKEVKLWQP